MTELEATYQQGCETYKSYLFGQQYKIIYTTFPF